MAGGTLVLGQAVAGAIAVHVVATALHPIIAIVAGRG